MKTFNKAVIASAIACTSLNSFAAIAPGELIITEFMANPAAVSDSQGEWFEVLNTSNNTLNLNGLVIRDAGSNFHTVNASNPVEIGAGEYFVFGRNDDSLSNGGYNADYQYASFSLGNSSDAIVLEYDQLIIDSVFYSAADGLTAAGNSAERTPNGFQLTPATVQYGLGDVGTPGSVNSISPSPVPVPAAAWLFGSALSLMVMKRRKS